MRKPRAHILAAEVGGLPLTLVADVWPGAPATRLDPEDPPEVNITAAYIDILEDNVTVRIELMDFLTELKALEALANKVQEDFLDLEAKANMPPEREERMDFREEN